MFGGESFNEPPRPEVANKFAAKYLVSVTSFTRASSVGKFSNESGVCYANSLKQAPLALASSA
jgi:hypothetical protein